MNQALYAHMNNKRKMKKKRKLTCGYIKECSFSWETHAGVFREENIPDKLDILMFGG
jgi:hypothetical protein